MEDRLNHLATQLLEATEQVSEHIEAIRQLCDDYIRQFGEL